MPAFKNGDAVELCAFRERLFALVEEDLGAVLRVVLPEYPKARRATVSAHAYTVKEVEDVNGMSALMVYLAGERSDHFHAVLIRDDQHALAEAIIRASAPLYDRLWGIRKEAFEFLRDEREVARMLTAVYRKSSRPTDDYHLPCYRGTLEWLATALQKISDPGLLGALLSTQTNDDVRNAVQFRIGQVNHPLAVTM